MGLLEDRTAVFIVRVWCERGDGAATVTEWRGSVEHIQSGQRAFFRNLDAVLDFVRPHLEGIGIDAQQRFWERISSALDEPPATSSVAIPIPSADVPRADASTDASCVNANPAREAPSPSPVLQARSSS
jgi:hypothetical protein